MGELSTGQIEDLLRNEVIARLGCLSDGRAYVVPVTYVYDGTYVWGHAMEGAKLAAMRADPRVCVEVEHVEDLSNWRSVIARGRFEELFESAAAAAFVSLRERLERLVVSETSQLGETLIPGETPIPAVNGHASIYRIHLYEKTGRFERR